MAKDRKQVSAQQRRLLQGPAARQGEAAVGDAAELGEDDVWWAGGGDAAASSGEEEEAEAGRAAVQPRRRRQGEAVGGSAPVRGPARWGSYRDDEEEEEEGEEETKMPPHEYLCMVQEQRRRGAGGGSVLEGSGRTLKGRDMRRLRDAVWTQTGFFG